MRIRPQHSRRVEAVEPVSETGARPVIGLRRPFENKTHDLEPLRMTSLREFGTFGFELLGQRTERVIDEVRQGASGDIECLLKRGRVEPGSHAEGWFVAK